MKNPIKQNSESLPELINDVEKASKELRIQMMLLEKHIKRLKFGK